jgi:hypothetical protein
MATVTKDFKVKHGIKVQGDANIDASLYVAGPNATVNGSDIITEDIITGGTQTNIAVTYDPQSKTLNFVAENGVADSTTSDLAEGTNLYFTNERAQDAVGNSVGAGLTYDDASGAISAKINQWAGAVGTDQLGYLKVNVDDSTIWTGGSANQLMVKTGQDSPIASKTYVSDSINALTTSDIEEGTNLYFTAQRAIDAIGGSATPENVPNSVVKRDQNGSFAAENITANDLTADRLLFTGSSGSIDVNSLGMNIFAVNGDVNLGAMQGQVQIQGSQVTTAANVQSLTNKTINDELYFTNPSTFASDGGIKINDTSEDFEITAYTAGLKLTATQGVTINSNNSDIVFNADGVVRSNSVFIAPEVSVTAGYIFGPSANDGAGLTLTTYQDVSAINITNDGNVILYPYTGAAYVGGVSAGNEIATKSDLDTLSAGLNWKQAVNLLWDDVNASNSGASGTLTIDGHPTLTGNQNGYRILVTSGETAGIWDFHDDGTVWTLTRSADADTNEELVGASVFVMEGTTYGSTSWVQSNHYMSNFEGQDWHQFSGNGSVTAGSGITVNGLEVSIDRTTVDSWYDAAGAAGAVAGDLTTHISDTSTHGVTGDIVGTTDSQSLSNKTFKGQINFQSGGGAGGTNNHIDVNNSTGKMTVESGYALDLKSSGAVNVVSTGSDIVLNANGAAYVGSAASGNQIATRSYVDNQTTDDVAEGSTNLYFTNSRAVSALQAVTPNFTEIDIHSVAKQVAATVTAPTYGPHTAFSWTAANYRSAEFLVKIAQSTHTEVSKVLITLDTSNNVAITEYAIVGTNGALSEISAGINGSNVELQVSTIQNNSTITVVGTLLK